MPEHVFQPTRPPEPFQEGVVQAALEGTDEIDAHGRTNDFYAIDLDEGDRVRVWVTAAGGLDTMLEVHGPGDVHAQNDDYFGTGLNPLIELTAREDGEHIIRVLSFGPGVQGPYQLGLVRLNPAAGPGLDSGGSATGTISQGGAGPGMGAGAQHWFEATGGQRLSVRVTSAEFDTTATLVAPNGQVWSNDDANDTGPDGSERLLDSTVNAMAPVSGMYHLVIAPYGGNGNGTYRVRTTVRPPVTLAEGQQVPTVGYAGREGEGRILGLFAGITQYGTGRNSLYGCADDASLLAQAFRERGLQSAEQQNVLTDINANRAAFTAGLQRLASQATERDVVVIFFSGHGGAQPVEGSDPRDLDGTNETIVLHDGSMTDNEVMLLIDQITADVIILALDSCHSGGFADDFVSRPGRIGLFSSDADVLSDTAEGLGAGGYLSHALRRAVIGEADSMPTDGALYAGELTDYLHGSFIEHNAAMNPPSSTSPRQWLSSSRGSVTWNDMLWLYPRDPDGSLRPIPDIPLRSAPPGGPSRHAASGCD